MIDEGIVATSIEASSARTMLVTPSMSVLHGEACHGGGEPEEGLQAGERRAQPPDRVFHQCIHSDIGPELAVDLDE